MQPPDHSLDTSDFFIITFVAIVFIAGAVVLFRFIRNNKRERALRHPDSYRDQDDSDR